MQAGADALAPAGEGGGPVGQPLAGAHRYFGRLVESPGLRVSMRALVDQVMY